MTPAPQIYGPADWFLAEAPQIHGPADWFHTDSALTLGR